MLSMDRPGVCSLMHSLAFNENFPERGILCTESERPREFRKVNPFNLLFLDETNCRLYDAPHYAWAHAAKHAVLKRPKGQSPTFNVIATMGLVQDPHSEESQMILHYVVVPPPP